MKKIKKKYIFVSLLFLFLGGFVVSKLMNTEPKEVISGSYLPEEKDAKKMSREERQKAAEKEVDESKFTLSIYPEAKFKNGTTAGNIYIRNEVENAYPISVQIVEERTGDILYDSGAIQPGYEVTEGKLSKNLTKGNYKSTANVSIYDPETKQYKGQTAAEVQIEVES